jgi:hypothetical protein
LRASDRRSTGAGDLASRNQCFRNQEFDLGDVARAIAAGLDRLAGLPMDVVLMDLQYTTAIVNPDKIALTRQMVSLISTAAVKARVNVFRRFALMQRWCVDDGIPIADLIDPADPSQLHMTTTLREAQIAKICQAFVTGSQNAPANRVAVKFNELGYFMMRNLADHGLPLVQLKEQRRDLVVALQNRKGPVNDQELMQIAAIQQAISAFEDVIADLDAELEAA